MTVLAKPRIGQLRETGDLLIEPFCAEQVNNSSYDVTLGEWYWLETPADKDIQPYYYQYKDRLDKPEVNYVNTSQGRYTFQDPYDSVLNMYSESSVRTMWKGPLQAQPLVRDLEGIPKGTPVIVIGPGQNLLCHTHEFIGTTDLKHTTMMKARSSIGRNRIMVCACAGYGDIGFSNRWAMEVTNISQYRTTILVPGRRIAQIVFMETSGLDNQEQSYVTDGKYQSKSNKGRKFAELEAQWKPEDMLPKMWKDREVTNA